jgi:peptide/nickel transport system permease protein
MRYLMRRIVNGLCLLLGVSLLSFLLMQLAPGEFDQEMRLDPRISPATAVWLRSQYGLDRPLPVRYWLWLKSAVKGDFGFSFAYNVPVASLILPRIIHTLSLSATSTALAWLLAIPIGVWSAARKGNWRDKVCATATSTALAIPDLVLALGLLLIAVRTGWFPTGGMLSVNSTQLSLWGGVRDLLWHMYLPCTALVFAVLPLIIRHVRASMIEALDMPYVRAAAAHGISRTRIVWRHALPAAANPLISLFGMTVGALLSTSLLIEVVMSWPGLGPLVLEAIFARDVDVVIGVVLISAALLLAGNLLADLLLLAADPRIRRT